MNGHLSRAAERLLGRLPIGWLQLAHNRTRLVAAVGGVTFANVLIFMQLGFMGALFESSVLTHRQFAADLVVTSADYTSLREASPIPRARMNAVLAHPDVVDATEVFLGTAVWSDAREGNTVNLRVTGIRPDARVFESDQIQSQLHRLREPSTALIDRRSRGLSNWLIEEVGQGLEPEIELAGKRLRVVGLFEQGASFDVDGTLVVSTVSFGALFPARGLGAPSMILATCGERVLQNLEDEEAREAQRRRLAVEVSARLPEADCLVHSKEGFVGIEKGYQAKESPIGFVFGFGVVIGLVVGLVIVYQVLSTDVQDHLSEYATLKAVGYPRRFFLGIVFEEAVCLAVLGFVPGLLIASALYNLASSATALPIAMSWSRPVMVFAFTVVMCTASGAIATRRLNAADPAELF